MRQVTVAATQMACDWDRRRNLANGPSTSCAQRPRAARA